MIRGKKAPVLGRICMDQFMVGLENIPDAAAGDEVTLIGGDGELQITHHHNLHDSALQNLKSLRRIPCSPHYLYKFSVSLVLSVYLKDIQCKKNFTVKAISS